MSVFFSFLSVFLRLSAFLNRLAFFCSGTMSTADGTFRLLSFVHTPPRTSRALSLALLPFAIESTVTLGRAGGSFEITITSRAPASRPLTNFVVEVPLAFGASGVSGQVTGGRLKRDDQGRSVGGGAGTWDVVERLGGAGAGGDERANQGANASGRPRTTTTIVWKIEELVSTDRPARLTGQYNVQVPDASLSLSGMTFQKRLLTTFFFFVPLMDAEETRGRGNRLVSPYRSILPRVGSLD